MRLTEEITIPAKYLNYTDVFSNDSAAELPEQTNLDKHAIDLIEDKQPSYRPTDGLEPVELNTLKIYIETNLANSFIQPSKFSTWAPIFLFGSQMVASGSVSIIEDSITSR